MAVAKIEALSKFDLSEKLASWQQRHAEGKALHKAVPRESHTYAAQRPAKSPETTGREQQGKAVASRPATLGRTVHCRRARIRGQGTPRRLSALAKWAESYGDQTEQDHSELLASIKRGEIKANPQSDDGS
jgi:hypothetical protein